MSFSFNHNRLFHQLDTQPFRTLTTIKTKFHNGSQGRNRLCELPHHARTFLQPAAALLLNLVKSPKQMPVVASEEYLRPSLTCY